MFLIFIKLVGQPGSRGVHVLEKQLALAPEFVEAALEAERNHLIVQVFTFLHFQRLISILFELGL